MEKNEEYYKARILKLANLYYQEWLKTHDPYDEDFLTLLNNQHPDLTFHINEGTNEIIIL